MSCCFYMTDCSMADDTCISSVTSGLGSSPSKHDTATRWVALKREDLSCVNSVLSRAAVPWGRRAAARRVVPLHGARLTWLNTSRNFQNCFPPISSRIARVKRWVATHLKSTAISEMDMSGVLPECSCFIPSEPRLDPGTSRSFHLAFKEETRHSYHERWRQSWRWQE